MIADRRIPYPGLRAFRWDETDLFFGRDGCVVQMIDKLAQTRFLAVLGASGSGKSSLVRTGLLDGLTLGLDASAGSHWLIADMHPGGQPVPALAKALIAAASPELDAEDAALESGVLAEMLKRGPRSLLQWCRAGNLPEGHNLLLLVDQFEELFRYGNYGEREAAEGFARLLLESSSDPALPIRVVITMRSEFLADCALFDGLAERINDGLFLTPRMTRDECADAIEGPASVCGFTVEPNLTNRLLNDMAAFAPWDGDRVTMNSERLSRRADQLPLMQHVLNRLWVRAVEARSDPVLTLAEYDAIGGLQGALAAHGSEVIASLSEQDAAYVPAIFRALVVGESAITAVRRPCPFADLVALCDGDEVVARRIVETFRATGCDFLRPPPPSPLVADTIIDISHESLVRQWPMLAEWTRQEADASAYWRRLAEAARRHSGGDGELLSGRDLAPVTAWWDGEHPSAAWAERHGGGHNEVASFLAASRDYERNRMAVEQGRRARELRGRVMLGALLLVLAPCLILLIVTWSQVQSNRDAARAAQEATLISEAAAKQARAKARDAQILLKELNRQTAEARDEAKKARNAVKAATDAQQAAQATVEATQSKLADTRSAFKDALQNNPDKANLLNVGARAVNACEDHMSDPLCKAIIPSSN